MDSDTKVFCPCFEPRESRHRTTQEPPTTMSEPPTTLTDPNCSFNTKDVYFCTNCQSIKCNRCSEPEIESKYCPSCMSIARAGCNSCPRNCFTCPLCRTNLTVTPGGPRSYTFQCEGCEYSYVQKTESERLTVPLSRVVKASTLSNNASYTRFTELCNQLEREGLEGTDALSAVSQTGQKLLNRLPPDLQLKSLSVAETKQADASPVLFDEEADLSVAVQFEGIKNQITPTSQIHLPGMVPISTRLRTKKSILCKSCRKIIIKPDKEPTIIKFLKSSYFHDIFPTIKVALPANTHSQTTNFSMNDALSEETQNCTFLISFINNCKLLTDVTISTNQKHVFQIKSPPEMLFMEATIPVPHFKLGAKPEKLNKPELIVKTIPTHYLTKNTKLARVEAINRVGSKHDEGTEKGINWVSLNLKVKISSIIEEADSQLKATVVESLKGIRLPIFVTVVNDRCDFGCWCLINVGKLIEEGSHA